MKTIDAVDALIYCAPKVADILDRLAENPDFQKAVENHGKMSEAMFMLRLTPILLSDSNKTAMLDVLSKLSGKTVNELEEAPMEDTLGLIKELWTDRSIRLFCVALFGKVFTEGE